MEIQKITWGVIKDILKTEPFPDELICQSIPVSFSDPVSSKTYADFIDGKNISLSGKILEKYCADIDVRKTLSNGSVKNYFFVGENCKGIIDTQKIWKKYFNRLEKKYGKQDIRYKTVKKLLINLTQQPCHLTFTWPDEYEFHLGNSLKALEYDDISYRLSVYTMIAATWPIWEIVSKCTKDNLWQSYHLDRDKLCNQLDVLINAVIPKRITLNSIADALSPYCSKYAFVTKQIVPPLEDCLSTDNKKKYIALKRQKEQGNTKNTESYSDAAIENYWKIFHYNSQNDRALSQFCSAKSLKRAEDYLKIITESNVAADPYLKELRTYKDYPLIHKYMEIWEEYLSDTPDVKASLTTLLSSFYDSFDHYIWSVHFICENQDIDLIAELYSIREKPAIWDQTWGDYFIYQLSVFSIIGMTWPVWQACNDVDIYTDGKNNGEKQKITQKTVQNRIALKTLVSLIFPRENDDNNTISQTYSSESADELLADAIALLDNSNQIKAAAEKLIELIIHHRSLASNSTLRKAYDMLIRCRESGYRGTPACMGSIEEMRCEAQKYGQSTINKTAFEIKSPKVKNISSESGYYFSKCSNKRIFSWINDTAPEDWKPWPDGKIFLQDFSGNTLWKNLQNNLRFIFMEDDYTQNLNDALSVLAKLKSIANDRVLSPDLWGHIEIVIRCEQEKVTPLLDTACSFLDQKNDDGSPVFKNNPVMIHLLDEKKRSADLLYAQHPLFYALTLPQDEIAKRKQEFNLTIISDNHDIDYSVWLIRQAFWLLPHTRVNIKSKITVLSPYAKEIAQKTLSLCPGLTQFCEIDQSPCANDNNVESNLREVRIDGLPEINFITFHTDAANLEAYIKANSKNPCFMYYVVDSSTDLDAINIGIRIRETAIRQALQKKNLTYYACDETVIAVRCEDSDCAGLTKQLIVPKEKEHENRWYNDYKLISFGSTEQLFSWDELTGGTIEFMSKCIHFQYCTPTAEAYDYTKDAPADYVWSYYKRFYNRDSSYAAAMSLPYRLFESGITLRPYEWNFKDASSFWCMENRKILAKRFNDARKKHSKHLVTLNKWEHNRFCAYLLSTGWLPATPEETRYYMNNGVDRHTFQIARLHPCLCSWEDLIQLYNVLHQAYIGTMDVYGKEKHNDKFANFAADIPEYFQLLDTDNINQTSDILLAEPLPHRELENNIEYGKSL